MECLINPKVSVMQKKIAQNKSLRGGKDRPGGAAGSRSPTSRAYESIAVGERMFLGMQNFDFAQIESLLPKSNPFYTTKSLLGDVAVSPAPTKLSNQFKTIKRKKCAFTN